MPDLLSTVEDLVDEGWIWAVAGGGKGWELLVHGLENDRRTLHILVGQSFFRGWPIMGFVRGKNKAL
jgi:hypothetical protein